MYSEDACRTLREQTRGNDCRQREPRVALRLAIWADAASDAEGPFRHRIRADDRPRRTCPYKDPALACDVTKRCKKFSSMLGNRRRSAVRTGANSEVSAVYFPSTRLQSELCSLFLRYRPAETLGGESL
jgi:hypothetical protein